MPFDLEDKIRWDQLAPSLQDKFKSLWDSMKASETMQTNKMGSTRITIGPEPPKKPIEYCELWFDTNIMALRAYVHRRWSITRASWYKDPASSVVATDDANLSSNPRTNCHCYTIKYTDKKFCHCKTQLWDSSVVKIGSKSKLSFNKEANTGYDATDSYRIIIQTGVVGVGIGSINCGTEKEPGTDAIMSHEFSSRVPGPDGEYINYCEFDPAFDDLFDSTATTYIFLDRAGTGHIDIKFAEKLKLVNFHANLFPYSNGPVTITLQAKSPAGYTTICSETLAGNPQAYSVCHSHNCRDSNWFSRFFC